MVDGAENNQGYNNRSSKLSFPRIFPNTVYELGETSRPCEQKEEFGVKVAQRKGGT